MVLHNKEIRLFVLWIVVISNCGFAYVPEVNHRAIAGLWKLIPKKTDLHKSGFQKKEFTVFPKKKEKAKPVDESVNGMLLMLHEDGHFVQYADDDKAEGEVNIPDKMRDLNGDNDVLDKFQVGKIHGQWALVDGVLKLAADRPINDAGPDANPDTLLEGKVVAHSEESLQDNPALQKEVETQKVEKKAVDTHLSVPKGKINTGRFFYPKKHPSFFEQPMFKPTPEGMFELKQVLGSLNAQSFEEENELIEKFRQKDFHGKRFLLSSHPLGQRRPKGNTRWSIKYNRYVEDPPSKEARKRAEEEEKRPANIRVVEVAFFANNTFATISGLGDNILRGKYHIVGEKRDHLWMQVWRFGFGRSVSGSVFSEGNGLTKDDEKTYWGEISYEGENDEDASSATTDSKENERRLTVKGSVIFGYGLEPQPVGRFIMAETTESESFDDDDDVDEEDSEDWLSNAFQ